MKPRQRIFELYSMARRTVFVWGIADCLTWCGDVAKALTGADPIAHLRERYSTARGALRVMRNERWKDMADVAGSIFAEIPPARAVDGDWGWFKNDDGTDGLGVVCGAMLVARGQEGLVQVSRMRMERAFRVE